MREWAQALLLALPIAAVGLLSPSSAGLSRALRSALAAVMLVALLSPLAGLDLSALVAPPSVESFAPEEGAAWQEAVREGFCRGLEAEIRNRFSMKVEIRATFGEDGTPQSAIAILEKGELFGDAVGMVHYIEKAFGIDCAVEYGESEKESEA